jgi:hypothetical protein
MTSSSTKPSLSLVLLLLSAAVCADDSNYEFGGHAKVRLLGESFPSDSIFNAIAGSSAVDLQSNLRLNFKARKAGWTFDTAYQFLVLYGDTVEYSRDLPELGGLNVDRLPNDDRRLFDLTHTIYDEDKTAVVQRLDRLWLGYTSEKAVVRFGRQALSWGNGLFYAPMDLVNPFDPAAIDTEFKTGDDMLYVQYLRDSGDDVQGAAVFRRELDSGDVESSEATVALKYHGFAGETEYDLLVATSYDDPVIGFGVMRSVGGALASGDIVITDTSEDTYLQVVANISYSWIWGSKNVSGALEYYFNGFGQHAGEYDPESLAENPDLLLRLSRGELFTLGRNYLAGSLTIEVSPLWTVTPTLLANVGDPSGLLQLITQYSLGDNMTLLGSLNVPLGDDGTEFGGIDIGIPDLYLSRDAGLFAQFAVYF